MLNVAYSKCFSNKMRNNSKNVFAAFIISLLCQSSVAHAYSQQGMTFHKVGSGVPMGHEWITRLSFYEVIGGDPVIKDDPNDPRKKIGRKDWQKIPT